MVQSRNQCLRMTSSALSLEWKVKAEHDTDEEARDFSTNEDESQKPMNFEIHADIKPKNSSGRSEKLTDFNLSYCIPFILLF